MPTNIYPMGENDTVLTLSYNLSNGSTSTDDIVPYVVNGKSYTLKLVRNIKGVNRPHRREINKRNNADPNILGYANMKEESFFPDQQYLLPDETIPQFHFKNGYFDLVHNPDEEGDYQIRMQLVYRQDKIREIYHTYNFIPYATPLTNENVLRMNKEKQEEKEREARERRERNEKKMEELLHAYVMNSNDIRLRSKISTLMYTWPELNREIIVFRGQRNPMIQEIRTSPESFFSTSLDWWLANQQFTSVKDNCCLFVIRAQPGLKYYSTVGEIEEAIRKYNNARAGKEGAENAFEEYAGFEEEVLLEGNGQFYQDKEKTRPGFRELTGNELAGLGITFGERPMTHQQNGKTVQQTTGVFEAYYFPRTEREVYQGFMLGNGSPKKGGKRRKTRKQSHKKRKTRKQ